MIHLSEDELSIYAIGRDLLDDPDSADAHLGECSACREVVLAEQQFDDVLRHSEPWCIADPAGDNHRRSLRLMAIQTQLEDKEAGILLATLLASPGDVRWGDLVNEPAYRTAGVVRRLAEAAHQVCPRIPLEALALSHAAIAISAALPDDLYPSRAVSWLRGIAWKELANALRYLDRFHEALDALTRAEAFYRELSVPDLDLAIIGAIRAFLLFEMEDFDGADQMANRALEVFRHLGQKARSHYVMSVQGSILRDRGKTALAAERFRRLLEVAKAEDDATWKAITAPNLAWCLLEAGELTAAAELFRTARKDCMELGFGSDVTRCDWGLAIVSRDLGNYREALTQLLAVSGAFAEQQVVVDSAWAMVEAFEIMLALGEADEIERLATGLVATLTEAGRMQNALTALAYIKEAAARKSMNPEILAAARTFLRRAGRNRDLIFAPPRIS